jgi:hypothetical protein
METEMSANGYKLEVKTHTGTFQMAAAWAAPYFVLDTSVCHYEGDKPSLYHAETLADAQRVARFGGKILDSQFEVVA